MPVFTCNSKHSAMIISTILEHILFMGALLPFMYQNSDFINLPKRKITDAENVLDKNVLVNSNILIIIV